MRFLRVIASVFLASLAWTQVPVAPMPVVHMQFLGTVSPLIGLPLAGGKLCTYAAGTTTPLASYTDSTGSSQNTNPVILDVSGSANIWLAASSYKFVLYDAGSDNTCSTGVLQWSVDNVSENTLLNAVVKNPAGSATQTISGPLSLGSFAFNAGKINGTLEACNQTGADIGAQVVGVLSSGVAIHICEGTHIVSTSMALAGFNNVRIFCDGPDTTILTSVGGTLGANPIFNLNGSSGTHISNVRIDGCTIRNGTANNTNFTSGMDGITANFVDGLELDHLKVTNTQGTYGIQLRNTTRWRVHDSYFLSNTYCAFCQNSDNLYGQFDHNTIDTLVCNPANAGNCPQVYAVASGNDATAGTNFSSYYSVDHNTILNTPHWEGIDFHGGHDIDVEANTVINANICVNGQIASSALITNFVLDHVRVIGNTCVQGTGDPDNVGINIQGDGTAAKYLARNVEVEGNTLSGFGSTSSDTVTTRAAIEFNYIKNLQVIDNTCISYNQNCINFNIWVQGFKATGNKAKDLNQAKNAAISTMFLFGSTGVYDGLITADNTLEASSAAGVPAFYLRGFSAGSAGGIVVEPPHLKVQPTVSLYSNAAFLGVNRSSVPASLFMGRNGDRLFTSAGQVGWTVSNSSAGMFSVDTADTVVTGNITNGQNTFTITGAGSVNGVGSDYRFLPEGINVVCGGCGVASADLNCIVTANDNSTGTQILTLINSSGAACNASTSQTGTTLKYQALTFAAFQINSSGDVLGNSFSAPTFKLTTGAFTGTITGAFTANRAQSLPDAAGTYLITGNGNSPIQTASAAGCTTGAGAGSTCNTSVSWTTAFADTNYRVACMGAGIGANVPVNGGWTAKAAGSVTFVTVAGTAAAASFTNIECTAVHN